MSDLYPYILFGLGMFEGALLNQLIYEFDPSMATFKNGVDPQLQAALAGASLVVVFVVSILIAEVFEA